MSRWFAIDRSGCTRTVVLLGGFVYKVPCCYNWESFLRGLLANLRERTWSKSGIARTEKMMPPVVWVAPGGWLCIQRRCRPIRHRGLFWVDLAREVALSRVASEFWLDDVKPENFAWLGTQLVKIDLGSN